MTEDRLRVTDAPGAVAGAATTSGPGATPQSWPVPGAEPSGPELASAAPVVDAPVPRSLDPRVDDALSRLAEVDGLPLAEQVEVFSDIHRRLAAVLADPDSRG